MSIQYDGPLSEYASSPIEALMPYYPYFALFVVAVSVAAIFYMRWNIRRLKEGLHHSPQDKVLLRAMKIAKIRQFMNYGMLVVIGVGTYLLTHVDSLI